MRIVKIILLCAVILSCDGFDAYEAEYNETVELLNIDVPEPEIPKPLVEPIPEPEPEPIIEIEEIIITEEVIYMNDVYKNDKELHLPDWVIGKWRVRETGMIQEVTEAGFVLSPEAALYPNPVTSGQFINVDGTSNEEVQKDRYFIEASGEFLHEPSGRKYGGGIKFEFIRDGDTITLNGKEVVKD